MTRLLVILSLLFVSCNQKYYTGVVVSKDSSLLYGRQLECKVTNTHFINPSLNFDEWDSLQIGDTVYINPETLKLVYER